MAIDIPNKRKPRKRRTTRWVMLVTFVMSALAVIFAYRRYADPQRVRAEAEAFLQQFAQGRVRVGSGTFSIFDGIRLYDVAIEGAPRVAPTPERPISADADSIFLCRELQLTHDPVSALWGRLRIRSVVAIEPICSIVHDPVRGTTNIAGLFQDAPSLESADAAMPTVELRDARIRVVYRDADEERTVDEIVLTLRGRPSQRNPGLYDLVWQGSADSPEGGHSQIDLRNGRLRNVRGGLPSLSIESVMLAVAAGYDGAGAWCDLFGLDGRVRARDYNLIGGIGAEAARSATIDLRGASLSIPIQKEERGLASDQRYLRFENVDGTVLFTTEAIRAEFTGRLHGSECKVSASMRGGVETLATLDDVDFDAHLTVTALELPRSDAEAPAEQVRFIQRFPQLSRFFRDFDPHGLVDVDIAAAKRAGPDESLQVQRILITARGGDASSHKFPYRGSSLTGSVEYRSDGVWIRHVCGEHDEGTICVDGRLDRPDPCASAELTIHGENIPIDDHLFGALGASYDRIREQLRPQGRIDVDLALHRPACNGIEPGAWRSETTVRFDDLSASYVGLPYAVDHLAGELIVEGKRLSIVHMNGSAEGAQVQVTGEAALASPESLELRVAIVADGVEFNDRLLAALPEGFRANVAALHPTGRFDLRTSLALDPVTRQVLSGSTVTLRGASVHPESFPVKLSDVEGIVRIDGSAVTIDQAVGGYKGATISATGVIGRGEKAGDLELTIQCRDLRIDDELRTAAPLELRRALTDWSVDGPIGVDILVRRNSTEEALAYFTRVEFDGVTVRHPRFPIPFEDVHGAITIGPTGTRGTELYGRYNGADVRVDFQTDKTQDGDEGTIVLSAIRLPLDASVRGLLPESLRGAWDRAGLLGRVDVRCKELHYHYAQGSPDPTWRVDGQIDLRHVDAANVAVLGDLSGSLTFSGTLVDQMGGATLSGRLQQATARVHGRDLSDIQSAWSLVRSAGGAGRLSLAEMHAAIYDGVLTGHAELQLDPHRTEYDLTATVNGMQIAPWLRAGRIEPASSATAANDDTASQVRGSADAYLYLSGVLGDPLSRRGGGRLEVRDGYIYRLPILLAILNVLDLSVPNDEALHTLEADFFVMGNQLSLEEIALRGGSLTLVGTGSMSLPDQAVDLHLVNVGGRSWARIPVLTDLVEGATRDLVELRVTGPVSRPTVRAQPLRALSEELKRLFQKKPPKKIVQGGS